MFLFNVEPKG